MYDAANIWHGLANIYHVQFQVFWAFQREKYTFPQKCSKIGQVAKKLMITFRGGQTQK